MTHGRSGTSGTGGGPGAPSTGRVGGPLTGPGTGAGSGTDTGSRTGTGAGAAPGAAAAPGTPYRGVAGPRGTRTRRNRSATRRRLFDAAVTLIAEQGFSATTVDEIAERAGVAKGTVYYNFGNKNEFFEELLRYGVGLLTADLRQAARDAAAAGGGTAAVLDAMVRAGLAFIDRSPAFTQLYVAELWRTNRAWHSTLLTARQDAVLVVETALREGVASGELSDRIDVPLTAAALVGMVLVAALDWKAFQPERSLEEVHATLALLLQGCLGGGPVAAAAGAAPVPPPVPPHAPPQVPPPPGAGAPARAARARR